MRDDVLPFAVIPGPPQAEPGIQWLGCDGLPRALSAWVGVRIGGAIPARPFGPSGMTSTKKGARCRG